MTRKPREYAYHLTKEFYASYEASSMNFTAHTEITKKGKKAVATTWPPLAEVVLRGEVVDISETTLKRFLHGPEYTTPSIVGLFEGRHHAVASEVEMEDRVCT
ncbi:hypothetical protein KY290_010676 [Solanum tuberosum]|uniref:Uncharacterized protein n=1 Tax=Solanum tuberosum TaxID=4113 RepID=A0ABQ7VYJ8_SOLTU|nr:hypothetical protein KY290_010676 [Solanum tuberosum]